jgi:hypothetical protein
MNRPKLLEMLQNDNIPQHIQNIYNLYKTNLILVKIEDRKSEWKVIDSRVRQGCGLSPILFIIYMNAMASKYNMELSIQKSKVMAFCGKEPVPSKICLNNKMIERTNDFTYLGYKLSFQGETDLLQKNYKITKYTKFMGIINLVLKLT